MKDHLIFFLSAYLLFALFLTIHIFTANVLAEAMAGFFGLSMVVNLTYNNREYIKERLEEAKYQFTKLIRYISIH